MTKVVVVGSGAWGTALAAAFQASGNDVSIYSIESNVVDEINTAHENKTRLPGVMLSPKIRATLRTACLKGAHIVVLATPAQTTRSVLTKLKSVIGPDTFLLIGSKGIEVTSGSLLTDVIGEILPKQPVAVLSGPAFAKGLGNGQPTACTLACARISSSRWLASTLSNKNFRLYPTDDLIGCQLGGALKNVIAIAAGIAEGLELGENARAAVITRGLHEIARLGVALGGRTETFMGLSGLGDMILTATSASSRNFKLGLEIGKSGDIQKLAHDSATTQEGVHTVKAIKLINQKRDCEMPISEMLYDVLYAQKPIHEGFQELLDRPLRSEERS